MTMREERRWICSNPKCRCEIHVAISAGTVTEQIHNALVDPYEKGLHRPILRLIHFPDELKSIRKSFLERS